MAALKLFFLTILTYVYVSNGSTITKPIELTGPEREAAVERLYTGLHKVVLAGGPVYKVLRVNKVTNHKMSSYPPVDFHLSVDTYDVDLVVGRVIKKCIVEIRNQIQFYPPTKVRTWISIVCNGKPEYSMNY
ncbi:uncharacterized protein LOC117574419 [Drosophila albomicans]|uniref:Uncharacterized protein LOC117574419 n=1 Tax=Drosophila albomicans TaxID=7291 RepID=A0A9C6T9N0_DROAB|nr:uncharacterized protein LOC117574419 [Drosophila albomicans]